MAAKAPEMKGEQAPKRQGLFNVPKGMHGVVWERDKDGLSDPVEDLRDQGYEILTDPDKRRGLAVIPNEEYVTKEKEQHKRSLSLQYGKASKGEIRVVEKPVTLADFAKEDEDYTREAKAAGIVPDDES
jgi:hypothetical protein